MKEEKAAIEKRLDVDQGVYYWDVLHERAYGKVIGSFAWPGKRPGYGLILGADRWEDPAFNARHIWGLAEKEKTEIHDLFRWMVRATRNWQVEFWFGDFSSFSMATLLEKFNEGEREKAQPGLRCEEPTHLKDPERFKSAMISSRTYTRPGTKVLHLGPCEILKSQLRAFPLEDVDREEKWPALRALSFALDTAREMRSTVPKHKRQEFAITDYDPFGGR